MTEGSIDHGRVTSMLGGLRLLQRIARSRTVGGTAWLTAGYSVRVAFQASAYLLLARSLGPAAFGIVAASAALVSLLSPLVELGGYSIVAKYVSIDSSSESVRHWLGNALVTIAITAPIALLVAGLANSLFLQLLPFGWFALIALADFVAERARMIIVSSYVATHKIRGAASLEASSGAARLLAVLLLMMVGPSLELWLVLYFAANFVVLGQAITVSAIGFGTPRPNLRRAKAAIGEGLLFAVAQSARNAYTDVDKAMLGRLALPEAAGVYSVAYRVINLAFLPLNALMSVMYPRFFRAGAQGIRGAIATTRRTLLASSIYGAVAGLLLYLAAPLLPRLLGADYAAAVGALRLLAIVPVLQALYRPFADALTGAGMQRWRTLIQVMTLALNVFLNLRWIPSRSWSGAAQATISSEFALLVLLVTVFLAASSRGTQTP